MLGNEITVDVGAPAAGGGFVGRAPDGRVVFVRHSLQGEQVRAVITEETSSYLRADAIEILRPSEHRVLPTCPHAGPGRCGGCDWQHIELHQQRAFKAQRIEEHLARIAGLQVDVTVEPVSGDKAGLGWRTRVGYGVDRAGFIGFHRYRSTELELVDHCPLVTPGVEQLGIERQRWHSVQELNIFASSTSDDAVIDLKTTAKTIKVAWRSDADLVINGKLKLGSGRVGIDVLGRHYTVSAGVFWQVHPGAAEMLGRAVLEGVGDITGHRVLDLYCGAGLFTAQLARMAGPTGEVLGIERDRRACEDARRNTADLPTVSIMQQAVTAKTLTNLVSKPSTVVLDPSREGAGREVMSVLTAFAPTLQRMVYVSCDPATFARDVRTARDAHWTLDSLRAFDLFPMTEHVELVGVLRPE